MGDTQEHETKMCALRLASLSGLEKIRAMAFLSSQITIGTRQIFVADVANGRERGMVDLLHGINELHHTIAHQAIAYSFEEDGFPPDVLARQLIEIADQYGLQSLLAHAVAFVRTRNLQTKA